MNGTKLNWKDGITIILFIIAVLGYINLNGRIAEQALQKDQVERNKQTLEKYDLGVISYQLNDIKDDVSEIKELVKALQ